MPNSDKIHDQDQVTQVTQDRINEAMNSISESVEPTQPSKLTGQFHALKGSAVEAIGNVTGWEAWKEAGKEEHQEGRHEYRSAQSWWPPE